MLKPDPEDKSKCSIQVIIEADAMGYVPGWVKTEIMRQQAYSYANLRKFVPLFIKNNPEKANEKV